MFFLYHLGFYQPYFQDIHVGMKSYQTLGLGQATNHEIAWKFIQEFIVPYLFLFISPSLLFFFSSSSSSSSSPLLLSSLYVFGLSKMRDLWRPFPGPTRLGGSEPSPGCHKNHSIILNHIFAEANTKIGQAHKHLHLTKSIYNEGIQAFSK